MGGTSHMKMTLAGITSGRKSIEMVSEVLIEESLSVEKVSKIQQIKDNLMSLAQTSLNFTKIYSIKLSHLCPYVHQIFMKFALFKLRVDTFFQAPVFHMEYNAALEVIEGNVTCVKKFRGKINLNFFTISLYNLLFNIIVS